MHMYRSGHSEEAAGLAAQLLLSFGIYLNSVRMVNVASGLEAGAWLSCQVQKLNDVLHPAASSCSSWQKG